MVEITTGPRVPIPSSKAARTMSITADPHPGAAGARQVASFRRIELDELLTTGSSR